MASVSAGSSVINLGDGTASFTTGTCTLDCGFQYQVSDLGGLTSNVATVTINLGSNIAPTASADSASVLVERSVTINVAANDSDPDGTVDLASIVITSQGLGNAVSNGDGTVTYTASATDGIDTFSYTIADNLGLASSPATVTVTVNPNPDSLSVQRAQCKADKNEWRVDGRSSILTPHSVTVYEGPTVGGTVIVANIPVDDLGSWRVSKNNTSAACVSTISIESSLGGKLENVSVRAN